MARAKRSRIDIRGARMASKKPKVANKARIAIMMVAAFQLDNRVGSDERSAYGIVEPSSQAK